MKDKISKKFQSISISPKKKKIEYSSSEEELENANSQEYQEESFIFSSDEENEESKKEEMDSKEETEEPQANKNIEKELFFQIKKLSKSKDNSAQRLNAILSAVTSVIKERNGDLIPTSYFAVLMTSVMENLDGNIEILSSTMLILSIIIPKIPPAVIRSKFNDILNLFRKLNQKSNAKSFLKAYLLCLIGLLKKLDENLWNQIEVLNFYQYILSFSIDKRVKLRKISHDAISSFFSEPINIKVLDKTTTNFLQQSVNNQELLEEPDYQSILSILDLLKLIFPFMKPKSIHGLVEDLWKLQALAHPQITLSYMKAFESLFGSTTSTNLNSDFYDQLFSVNDFCSLLELKPNLVDQTAVISYSTLMTKGIQKLYYVDRNLCMKKLPKYFSNLISNFVTEKKEISLTTAESFQEVIGICIDDELIKATMTSINSGIEKKEKTNLEKIISNLASGMRPPYKNSWELIFGVYSSLFQRFGHSSYPLLNEIVTNLGDFYLTEFQTEQFKLAIEKTLGSAITSMGPKHFLELLPLNLDKREQSEKRDWLLPLLNSNIRNTELKFFINFFLPLSQTIKKNAEKAEQVGRQVEAKNLRSYYYQIWDIFPGFCLYPTDLTESFKLIAETLGNLLSTDQKLHLPICNGLIYLIKTSSAPPNFFEPANSSTQKTKTLAIYSKNFLPILFNIYGENPSPIILDCITQYASVTKTELLNTFFKNVISKLLTATKSSQDEMSEKKIMQNRSYLTDLILAFVPHLNKENLDFLFKVIKPQLLDEDLNVQKKSFKVLRSMLEHHSKFVNDNFHELQELLTSSLVTSSPSSKKSRLYCLQYVIKSVTVSNMKSLTSVFADVILCTKESNTKARNAAFNVLQIMAEKLDKANLKEFLLIIIAGLGGTTPHMIAATVGVLDRLILDFHDKIDLEFIQQLILPVSKLFETSNREIMKSIFEFIRVIFSCYDKEHLKPNVESIIKTVADFSKENKHHFRMEIRRMFEKMLRRYGYDYVHSFVPESDQKLLSHIRKAENRKEKKKQAKKKVKNSMEAENSEESEQEEPKHKPKKKNQGTWLLESEEPVDFLDTKSLKSVVANKPKKQYTKQNDEFLEFDESGKLIVTEEEKGEKKKDTKSLQEDFMDIIEDQVERYERKLGKRKRQRTEEENENSEEEDESNTKKFSRPPNKKQKDKDGKGIHLGSEYQSKKAKGDMKKQGKPDPYAYLPLNPRMLNRKSKNKAVSQFEKVVNAAKRGAQTSKSHKKKKT